MMAKSDFQVYLLMTLTMVKQRSQLITVDGTFIQKISILQMDSLQNSSKQWLLNQHWRIRYSRSAISLWTKYLRKWRHDIPTEFKPNGYQTI